MSVVGKDLDFDSGYKTSISSWSLRRSQRLLAISQAPISYSILCGRLMLLESPFHATHHDLSMPVMIVVCSSEHILVSF